MLGLRNKFCSSTFDTGPLRVPDPESSSYTQVARDRLCSMSAGVRADMSDEYMPDTVLDKGPAALGVGQGLAHEARLLDDREDVQQTS